MVVGETGGDVWSQAVEVTPPSSHALFTEARLDSVACPASGSCVAIGEYLDSSDEDQAMAVSESGGVWGQAIEIPGVVLRSIACRAPGSCVALGTGRSGSVRVMGVSESNGVWGQPQKISLPANDASNYVVELAPLACTASGPCVAVGDYTDVSHQQRGLGLTESNGVWAPASEITSTPESAADVRLYSVACPASGPCVAVGMGSGGLAVGVSESNGKWGTASPISPPPNPLAKSTTLRSVACPRSGRCFAVGYDETSSSGGGYAVAVSASGGIWGRASEIAPPSAAGSRASAELRYVACAGSDSCVATGEYSDTLGPNAMAVGETKGEWGQASEITAPFDVPSRQSGNRAELEMLACPAMGSCAALGRYWDEFGNTRLMAAGTTPTPHRTTTVPRARVSLVGSAIVVHRNGRAVVRLSCAGTTRCVGRLALSVRTHRRRHRTKVEKIGTATFAIAPGTTATIGLKLDVAGRALLKAAHGRLWASLRLVEPSPAPSEIETRHVRLIRHR